MAAAREDFEDSRVYDLNLASGQQGNSGGGGKRNGTYSCACKL